MFTLRNGELTLINDVDTASTESNIDDKVEMISLLDFNESDCNSSDSEIEIISLPDYNDSSDDDDIKCEHKRENKIDTQTDFDHQNNYNEVINRIEAYIFRLIDMILVVKYAIDFDFSDQRFNVVAAMIRTTLFI